MANEFSFATGFSFYSKLNYSVLFLLGFYFKPTLTTHSRVSTVTAENDLLALIHDVSVIVETRVYGCFCSAFTNGLNLRNRFGDFE